MEPAIMSLKLFLCIFIENLGHFKQIGEIIVNNIVLLTLDSY